MDATDAAGYLELHPPNEQPVRAVGTDRVEPRALRWSTERRLETTVGRVTVSRCSYGASGVASLHPLDAALSLPSDLHSHEVARTIRWWASQREDRLDAAARKAIHKATHYLADRTRTRLMHYADALRDGLSIATASSKAHADTRGGSDPDAQFVVGERPSELVATVRS